MYYKKILGLALPAMGEQVLQMLMGTVDSYLVAQLGLAAISGVSVANQFMSLYQAIFIALATSAASLLANKSADQRKGLVASSLAMTVLVGLVLGCLSLLFGRPLFGLLGLAGPVKEVAVVYFSWVGGLTVVLGLMGVLSSVVRVQGRTKLPFAVNLLSSVVNLALSALFLFVFKWGVGGVALGTILARLLGCGLLWLALADKPTRGAGLVLIDKSLLRFSLPMIGERLMMRAGDVVVTTLVVSLGTAAVAGQALGETLVQFNYMPGLAMATATVILMAQENRRMEQQRLVRELYLFSLGLMWSLSAMVFLFGDHLLGLFTGDQAVSGLAKMVLFLSVCDVPFTAGTLVMTATWQGLGRPKLPFYATTLGMWLVRVLGSSVLVGLLGQGLFGVYLSIALDNAFRALFLTLHYRKYRASMLY